MSKKPAQKPHRSEQMVCTPRDLLDAVERRFGRIAVDLAASEENRVCATYLDEEENALAASTSWGLCDTDGKQSGVRWLNPPFRKLGPWAAKAAIEATSSSPVLLLAPASIGSNWFLRHVHGKAMVLALNPRVTFVGHDHPYPKDLILAVFGGFVGFDIWEWR